MTWSNARVGGEFKGGELRVLMEVCTRGDLGVSISYPLQNPAEVIKTVSASFVHRSLPTLLPDLP